MTGRLGMQGLDLWQNAAMTHGAPVTADLGTRPKPPRFGPRRLEAIAREHFGVEGRVSPLSSYIDQNALIRGADGSGWTLKVANGPADAEHIELQVQALERLRDAEPGLAPLPVLTLGGEPWVALEGVDGRTHPVWMVSYLDGPLLAEARATGRATWRGLGELLARVDRALAGLSHPALQRPFRWDVAQVAWTAGHSRLHADPQRRELVERAQVLALGEVAARAADLPQAVIYNDANDRNLVIDGPGTSETPARVVGLFDFGDMVRSARVFELAVAGAYAVLERENPLEVLGDLVAGYHGTQPLEPEEFELVFPALLARLVTSVTVAQLDGALDPDNAYIQVDNDRVWKALAGLVPLAPAAVAERLRSTAGLSPGPPRWLSRDRAQSLRSRHLGPSLSLSYAKPLEIVRGRGSYLIDKDGRAYLDGVNNVCHVGHCHPGVVAAAQEQIGELNTNTRYLHDAALRYAERLAGLLPDPLEVCYFVNSGSEANELALRLARTATGRHDMVVVRWGYHGHTSALIDLSSYKHEGPGGRGAPDWVHVAPCPDPDRGPHRGPDAGARYAAEVAATFDGARAAGREVAGFLAEPLIGCGGQIVPPEGWLRGAFEAARARGAVCIADEVQVGFGRVGSHWWAFEEQGAVPDIVTLGKPIGNGHPLAAVVTTRAIAEAFANGMEFFSTFGGNPVSCRVGLAVLDAIEDGGLREGAARTGDLLLEGLGDLARRDPGLGAARGKGLYLGLEFVRPDGEPDARRLAAVLERCRASGVLLSADGPRANVLKIKPPLTFGEREARLLLAVLERALGDVDG